MTEEQFAATRNIEIAIKALNDFVKEGRAIGVNSILDLSSAIEVSATYGYRDTPIMSQRMFE